MEENPNNNSLAPTSSGWRAPSPRPEYEYVEVTYWSEIRGEIVYAGDKQYLRQFVEDCMERDRSPRYWPDYEWFRQETKYIRKMNNLLHVSDTDEDEEEIE